MGLDGRYLYWILINDFWKVIIHSIMSVKRYLIKSFTIIIKIWGL